MALLCSPVLASAERSDTQGISEAKGSWVESPSPLGKGTHSVLGEFVTSTYCSWCKYAHGALMEIDDEGQYDFYYVTHVTNKCAWAADREDEFNTYGHPTVYFDGGYQVELGSSDVEEAKTRYINAIDACGARAVPNLTVVPQVVWVDDATLGIRIGITNNEAEVYEGYLRTFVTETASSVNWKDTNGLPYTYAFLDYSIKEPDLVIAPGATYIGSDTWVGAEHHCGIGDPPYVVYDIITRDNTTVIAGVYNDEWHQGYSYPPDQFPFDAYYVDEAEGTAPRIKGDTNGDDLVDIDDIFGVLGAWGPCGVCPEDVSQDGLVDIDDIFYVLANWT